MSIAAASSARQRPKPANGHELHVIEGIESNRWKMSIREVFHRPGYIEPYACGPRPTAVILVYSGDTGPCAALSRLRRMRMFFHMYSRAPFPAIHRPVTTCLVRASRTARTAARPGSITTAATADPFHPADGRWTLRNAVLPKCCDLQRTESSGEDMMKISDQAARHPPCRMIRPRR